MRKNQRNRAGLGMPLPQEMDVVFGVTRSMPRREIPFIKRGLTSDQPAVFLGALGWLQKPNNLKDFGIFGHRRKAAQPHFIDRPSAQRMLGKSHI
jgi:hypothetical protein